MGSTVLRALARQGHPADPTRLRTYREAARAHPCAQALDLDLALPRGYSARRCATSGQRNGSLPRSPTLLR